MLKFGLFVVALTLAGQGFARETKLSGSLSCTSKKNTFGDVTLKARMIAMGEANDGSMWDVIATVREDGSDETEVGRRSYLDTDENYKPTKYKDHSRFDLSKLVNPKDFSDFNPSDSCTLQMLVPNAVFAKAPKKGTKAVPFDAPVVVSCDQGGGSLTLACEVTPRED